MVNRRFVLAGLLVGLAALATLVLAAVLEVVIFAITVTYVLYPLRQTLVNRGFPRGVASGVATTIAFLAVVVLVAPIAYVIYRRRRRLIEALSGIPETISLTLGDTVFVFETTPYVTAAEASLRDLGIELAVAAPRFFLGLALFTILLFGLLYKPDSVHTAVFGLVPGEYHDVVSRLHERTRATLFTIYILQLATAAATFVVAFVVFFVLGYPTPFSLAVIAGILQFVPIVGPSVLVVGLALNDILLGLPVRAITVLALGLVFVSLLPDLIIRTKLAAWTGELSASLYFVGFVGGVLTVGALGLIVGPLVVALLVEVVELLSERETIRELQTE